MRTSSPITTTCSTYFWTGTKLELPDGRVLPYRIEVSPRATCIRIKLTARDGLTVVSPKHCTRKRIEDVVRSKAHWIASHLKRFDQVRHLLAPAPVPVRPEALDLPAIGESWRIEYRETRVRTASARMDLPGRLVVSGAVGDAGACQAALRRWLARRAREALAPWLERLSQESGLPYSRATIKGQRSRWGSCSSRRTISLNYKLLFLPREQVRYVLIHELCHTVEMNHSARFWALVRRLEPAADAIRAAMRDAWKRIPPWVSQNQGMQADP